MRNAITCLLLLCGVLAVRFTPRVATGFRNNFGPTPGEPPEGAPAEWTFTRLAYGGGGFQGSSWYVELSGAEYHFAGA